MEDFELRLRALEQQLRFWRIGAVVLAVGLGLFSIAGCVLSSGEEAATALPNLRVESLDLVKNDQVYAQLLVEGDSPQLRLLDRDGGVRARLWHDDEQTALFLNDGDGHTRVGVAQFAHGGGGFALHGEESKGAAVLYLANRKGSLSFIDENGKVLSRVAPESTTP
jgi:hypothetical protein